MLFVLLRIKRQYVSVHLAIVAIQFQMPDANWPTHVHIVPNQLCANSIQLVLVTHANVHPVTLDFPNQLDAIRSVNASVTMNVQQVHDALVADALTNAMIYAAQICYARLKMVKRFAPVPANSNSFRILPKMDAFVTHSRATLISIASPASVITANVQSPVAIKTIVPMANIVRAINV